LKSIHDFYTPLGTNDPDDRYPLLWQCCHGSAVTEEWWGQSVGLKRHTPTSRRREHGKETVTRTHAHAVCPAARSVPRRDNQPLTDICCFLCYRIALASLLLAGLDFGCLGVGCGVVRFFCLESSLPYLCRLVVIVMAPLASFPFALCLKTLICLLVSRKCCIAFFLRFGHLIRAQF
jgi:hypothetical protein